MLTLNDAHTSDVNVISWNKKEPLIVSGGDDGYLKVWDLRQFKVMFLFLIDIIFSSKFCLTKLIQFQNDSAVATFKHHTEPITTVQWHPTDSSVFASGGEDNQVVLWDLAVERDCELNEEEIKVKNLFNNSVE